MPSVTILEAVVLGVFFLTISRHGELSIGRIKNGELMELGKPFTIICALSLRKSEGRESTPNAAIIESQSVKTTLHRGIRGYDAAKKVTGRKRHLVVENRSLLLVAFVNAANILCLMVPN